VRADFFAVRRAVVFFLAPLFFRVVFLALRALERLFAPAFLAAGFFRAAGAAPLAGVVAGRAGAADVMGRSTAGAGGCAGIGVEGSISGAGDGISMSPSI
jgi:hypothetical protein